MLLGLGGVALLVGGIGIANVMVISVLERRTEIGVRRALGATKGHVRSQFLVEAILLSTLGGVLGIVLGVGITAGYGRSNITFSMPAVATVIGFGGRRSSWVRWPGSRLPDGRPALRPRTAIRPA